MIVQVIINYSVAMYELGLAAFTRRSFTKTWNALQDYDEDVRQLGYPRKETQTRIVAWVITVVSTIIWVIVNRVGMYAFSEAWTNNMRYLLLYIGTSIAIYKFVAMTFFLGQRFHHLNRIALKNLPSISGNESFTTVSQMVRIISFKCFCPLPLSFRSFFFFLKQCGFLYQRLKLVTTTYLMFSICLQKTILNLHNDLMIAAENLESIYSWSLLFWIGNLSLHIVSNVYFIIVWMIMKSSEAQAMFVLCLSAWLLAYLFQLLLLHIACHYASSQVIPSH